VKYNKPENSADFTVSLLLDYGQITLQSDSINEIYFIEDIFSYCVTGKIQFVDKYGVLEFGPITGNESITISYGEENDIEKIFYIYKISKIQGDNTSEAGTTQKIDIFFTDHMFYNLNFLQFSKSWKNQTISDIIFDISTDILGVSKWQWKQTTLNSLPYFYTPYWTANTALNWLLERSKEAKSGKAGMCWYNNIKGTNLVSLDTLLSQKKLMTIGDDDDGIYVFKDDNYFLFNRILGWSISGIDNTALRKISGETLLGYNNESKIFLIKEKKYTDMLKEHTVLGKKSLFSDKSDYRNGFIQPSDDNIIDMETSYQHQWNKLYDMQQLVSITVRGHEERYCGGLIELKWPSLEKTTQVFNVNLQGKYLVKSITHYFSGDKTPSYLQKLVLIKNGYEDTDAIGLVKSTIKNMAK